MKMTGNKKEQVVPRLRLRITAAAESILRSGHPWLFSDSIHQQNREGRTGELAIVYDRKDEFLAVGLFDPASPIRVRVLHAGKPQTIDSAWWSGRLATARERRLNLLDGRTTACRWINGESDGWPGLVMDGYDKTLVAKLYAASWLPWLDELLPLISKQWPAERIVLRLSRNIAETAKSQFVRSSGSVLFGEPLAAPVTFLETGLRFEADVEKGQKTGFFLDQRENRRNAEGLARGRRVLNAFSFSGAFSLYTARGGARSVTDVDISAHALAAAERNFKLNSADAAVAACQHELVQADAFEWLEANPRRKFELVILDPPSLAKREAERAGAILAYGRLAGLGIGKLEPGGTLLACSCSAHVTAEEFFAAVRQSAVKSGRRFTEAQTTFQPADHPAGFPEAKYLKAIYLNF